MSSPMEVCTGKSGRHDTLRNRMATLRGCVQRVAAQDTERGQARASDQRRSYSVPAVPDRMMLSYTVTLSDGVGC